MTSVTSSSTPGMVENSCSTPSIFNAGDGRTLQGRKEDPPQGISEGDAEAPFQRFTLEFAVGALGYLWYSTSKRLGFISSRQFFCISFPH